MNNLFEFYHNFYPLAKTICMGLTPVGSTQEMIEKSGILTEDEERANKYILVKKLADECHKSFINNVLFNFRFDEKLNDYYNYYRNSQKDDIKKVSDSLRADISNAFTKNPDYKKLSSKDLIESEIENYAKSDEEKEAVKMFQKFTTYFKNYFTNRKNMYVKDEESTAVAYRIINQNLPKFIDNIIAFEKISNSDFKEEFVKLNQDFEGLGIYDIKDLFTIDYYNFTITQQGIEKYNNALGGYSNSDGSKAQGINEKINLFNQRNKDKTKLPLLKPLFKQILSDTESISFIPEQFKDSKELLNTLNEFFNEKDSADKNYLNYIDDLKELFASLNDFDSNKIYIKNGPAITDLSQSVFEHWDYITENLNKIYDNENKSKKVKDIDKYTEQRRKYFKSIDSYKLKYLDDITNSDNLILNYLSTEAVNLIDIALAEHNKLKPLLEQDYPSNKSLKSDDNSVKIIKSTLDSLMALKNFIKPLLGSSKESDKDIVFYGRFEPLFEKIDEITYLYNKVRNFVSQKPYSTKKIKLNFGNPILLGGWAVKNEISYSSILLIKNNKYYLGIMDSKSKKYFKNYPQPKNDENCFKKMIYLQTADPQKDVQNLMVIDGKTVKKNGRKDKLTGENLILEELKNTYLPKDINEIRKNKTYSKTSENFSKENLVKFIDFYKQRVIEYYNEFNFTFKNSEDYADFGQFTNDINQQAYQIHFTDIPESYINLLVNEGKLYLFQIYNKDFSKYSKGTKNLHTMYFEMLFDERNLKDVVFKLNGEAEMFYRKASLDPNKITHPKNQPINNKNSQNKKKTSTFEYDLIKDKRYTVDKFSLHIPMTLNFKSIGKGYINDDVRKSIKSADNINIIGIDRGERNLIYITVIDSTGKILKQYSLNEIINENNGNTYATDYHQLLDNKEKERKEAKQEWRTVENIKELKEGYLSQVVHKIVQLMIKYNAIVVLEDLESGMKNNRIKVEKQIYQKFENALINKLRFCVDKTLPSEAEGGLLNAYQLVNSDDVKGKQNGFIFYIPPWNTSKIDPVTGFVNLFNLKLSTIESIYNFICRFDKISYNNEKDYFEFEFDYHNFGERCLNDYRRNWTVCTIGERIRTFRNKDKNNQYDNEIVYLTEEFKNLFNEYNINIHSENLIKEIQDKKDNLDKNFFTNFIKLFKLTVQLRNSKTGSTLKNDDYLISPVANKNGEFYDSRKFSGDTAPLPQDADANGAYNIARKGLFVVEQIKSAETDKDLKNVKFTMSNKEWLEYTQKQDM